MSAVINPMAKFDVLKEPIDGHISPKPYLGYIFESKAAQLKLSPEEKDCVRRRCVTYNISLANELTSRLPDNVEILQHMSLFNVGETLKLLFTFRNGMK